MSEKRIRNEDEPTDAFSRLGISADASFEEIQGARDKKLLEAGEDIILKAKIEASYDSLLMHSLKARRLGKVSNEAVNASNKESNGGQNKFSKFGGALLTKLSNKDSLDKNEEEIKSSSFFSLPNGEGLSIRLSIGFLAIVLFLISPDNNIKLILSLSTIAVFVSQIKRGRKISQSLGWSVVFLSSGYIIGGVIVKGITEVSDQALIMSIDKLEAFPALILLWVGSLLLA